MANNVITIIHDIDIEGENGVYSFYFLRYRQYTFVDTAIMYREHDDFDGLEAGGVRDTHIVHYKVVSDDAKDYFWVPSNYTARENFIRTKEQQDLFLEREKDNVHPRKWREVVKMFSGVDPYKRSANKGDNYISG